MASRKINLTVTDVCSILETAAKAGVLELKFGTLHVRFPDPVLRGTSQAQSLGQTPAPAAEIADTQEKLQETALVQDELSAREDQLSQMFIEDPMIAEQMLAEGDLIDDTTDGEGEQEA